MLEYLYQHFYCDSQQVGWVSLVQDDVFHAKSDQGYNTSILVHLEVVVEIINLILDVVNRL